MADLFKEKSQDWDKMSIPQQLSKVIGPAIIEKIKPKDTMKVLDFGAGTGLLTSHIAPRVKKVAAVDISASMLDKLMQKSHLQDRVVCYCQDIIKEPLQESFDLIVSAMAVHHVKDTEALLKRFYEHLLPGGFIALADLDKEEGDFHPPSAEGVYHHGFERDLLAQKVDQAGFKSIEFSTVFEVKKEDKTYPIFLLTAQKV